MQASKYFVVAGKGLSRIGKLNAFDHALVKAGIAQCNLVKVSSILPKDAKRIDPIDLQPGAITHCVLARMDGVSGEHISAGLGWAHCSFNDGSEGYGLVAENTGYKNREALSDELELAISEMIEARDMRVDEKEKLISFLDDIPDDMYGCVIVALVYVFDY